MLVIEIDTVSWTGSIPNSFEFNNYSYWRASNLQMYQIGSINGAYPQS